MLILSAAGLLIVNNRIFAQEQNGWTAPHQLSSEQAKSSEAFPVVDQYGNLHVFWIETGFPDRRSIIQYARFDGRDWSLPVDIYVTGPQGIIGFLSPFVDQQGLLHLAWTGGTTGPIFYMTAPADDALSAKKWSNPQRIDAPAYQARLLGDSAGVFHLLFSNFYGERPGIYYIRSEDRDKSWAAPVFLDPYIPNNQAPINIQFAMTADGTLHAVWHYLSLIENEGRSVRYARSTDGGSSWSAPYSLDEPDESPDELRMAVPNMVVQDEKVYVVWAGTENTNREYKFSPDSGQSWSPTIRIFGEFHGQAIGDGLAVDSEGRIHFVGQIRWPQGIYHAYLDQGQWSKPTLAYLISASSLEPIGDRVHAHRVRLAIRAGNQLVAFFNDSPNDSQQRLFVMDRVLEDVPESKSIPINLGDGSPLDQPDNITAATVGTKEQLIQPTPTSSQDQPLLQAASDPSIQDEVSPNAYIWVGLVPTALIFGILITYHLIRRSS